VPDAGEAAVCRVLPVVGTQILATVSRRTIARTMNDEQVPLFGQGNHRGKIRQNSLVRQLLHTPTIIGTFVPFSTEWVDGIKRMRPLTPIENYDPAIIKKPDRDRVQARRAA
jgi:hypothetical protein